MKKYLAKLMMFLTNRNGLFLVFSNFLLAILGVRSKGWSFSGFHYYYEPLEIKILMFINLPAILAAQTVYESIYTRPPLNSSLVTIYDFEMALIVLFSCLQWLLIGTAINFPFQKRQEKNK